MDSILWELIMRSNGSMRRSRPNLAIWAVNCVFVCCDSITCSLSKISMKLLLLLKSAVYLRAPDPEDSLSAPDL